MNDRPIWFAPKRYGYGAGLPVAREGWAVLAAFMMVVGMAGSLFGTDNPAALSIIVPAIAVLIFIAAKTTRGGWRWRWGARD